jgi:hypothetical protein
MEITKPLHRTGFQPELSLLLEDLSRPFVLQLSVFVLPFVLRLRLLRGRGWFGYVVPEPTLQHSPLIAYFSPALRKFMISEDAKANFAGDHAKYYSNCNFGANHR